MRGEPMALENELATYQRELPALLVSAAGKFVLIHGREVAGVYDTYQDAISAGYARFQLEAFLVKQVAVTEQVQYISRDWMQCHT